MTQHQITDDLEMLLAILPVEISQSVTKENNIADLLEIVMDLGRVPTARMVSGEIVLVDKEVTKEDIDHVVRRLGDIDEDNRGGLERTLHRISAIRNRKGEIVGLTCRVGRAVYGTLDIIEDLIEEGKSVLLLGRPGVGKTTLLREAARIMAETKRVVIVDTSNEIGGDGDVPHPAVGRARRMQVATPSLQHEVMIEAVENHSPEVIVIDEIGRQQEATAARTIAERGVQLVGTAHGNTLDNLMLNPTLSDLIGGIESVTLSDDEARRRGTQKTVLERRSPPTFDILIEIQTRNSVAVHKDVGEAVDATLRGFNISPEVRTRNEDGKISIQKAPPITHQGRRTSIGISGPGRSGSNRRKQRTGAIAVSNENKGEVVGFEEREHIGLKPLRIFPYGVARNRLQNAAKRLRVPVEIVNEVNKADVLVTLRTHYRKRQRIVIDAEHRGMPVYVLRANTVIQMERFMGSVFDLSSIEQAYSEDQIVKDTEQAIKSVLNGERWIEMRPVSSFVRRIQHQMAKDANLVSHSYGKEPNRRVRIFRE